MIFFKRCFAVFFAGALVIGASPLPAGAAKDKTDLVAVSVDIVEISGSIQSQVGFGWNQLMEFAETEIPGIIHVGEFARKTALATTLRLLETEGKAQLLSNPKVVVRSGEQADFMVGGEIPYPTVNNQGVGFEYKRFGVILKVLPVVDPERKGIIVAQLAIEVSNPDFSKAVTIQNTSVPSFITRQVQTVIELKNGETVVLGGLKRSERTISKTRVPVLGRIPLLGRLFTNTDVVESQSSLYLFIEMELLK